MYFLTGWPHIINLPADSETDDLHSDTCALVAHPFLPYILIILRSKIQIWDSRKNSLATQINRSKESVIDIGYGRKGCWHHDGEMFIILTNTGNVIIFKLTLSEHSYSLNKFSQSGTDQICYYKEISRLTSQGYEFSITLIEEIVRVSFNAKIISLSIFGNYIILASSTGFLHHLDWEGGCQNTKSFPLVKIVPKDFYFTSTDKIHQTPQDISITEIYCSTHPIGLFVIYNEGRVLFLASSNSFYLSTDHLTPYTFQSVFDACNLSINSKFRLVAVGCLSGQVQVWKQDMDTAAWNISHLLQPPSPDISTPTYPTLADISPQSTKVASLKWSVRDGKALSVLWARGLFAVYSVFGALMAFTENFVFHGETDVQLGPACWPRDGYSFWILKQSSNPYTRCVIVLNFLKSALVDNPILGNQENLVLHSSTTVYIHPKSIVSSASKLIDESIHTCKTIPVDPTYIMKNWPIRYVAYNSELNTVAICGSSGLTICNVNKNKWKLFVNEIQETSFVCNGGLAWWNEIIIMASTELTRYTSEVNLYSMHLRLDNNQTLHKLQLSSRVNLLDIYLDNLLILTSDNTIRIYNLKKVNNTNNPTIQTHLILNTSLQQYSWANTNIISISMSTVQAEATGTVSSHGISSILINVEGYLMMLQVINQYNERMLGRGTLGLISPVCLATAVEIVFSYPNLPLGLTSETRPYLTQALWLACGQAGLKVWLPLFPSEDVRSSNYLSKYIMLTIYSRILPLSLSFEDGTVTGVMFDTIKYDKINRMLPYFIFRKVLQFSISLLLKQLLKRNLMSHALRITKSCAHLPHFEFILEYLVHEALEEESGQGPKPNTLLPYVITLVKNFPQFIKILGACARKTELAVWPSLFGIAGKPVELFESCMENGDLDASATYLLILQTIEHPDVSRQYAARLLNAALESSNWELSVDLVRFIKSSIALAYDTPLSPKVTSTANSLGSTPTDRTPDLDRSLPIKSRESLGSSSSLKLISVSANYNSIDEGKMNRPNWIPISFANMDGDFVDVLFLKHARKLFSAYNFRELAKFSGYLDFSIIKWLQHENNREFAIENYSEMLQILHDHFQWPYPKSVLSLLPKSDTDHDDSFDASHDDIFSPLTSPQSVDSLSTININLKNKIAKAPTDSGFVEKQYSNFDSSEIESLWAPEQTIGIDEDSNEMMFYNTRKREQELRYYLNIFAKSHTYEWWVLFIVLLQDVDQLRSCISDLMNDNTNHSFCIAQNVSNGLGNIQQWCEDKNKCAGYVGYFASIKNLHDTLLSYIVEYKSNLNKLDDNDTNNRINELDVATNTIPIETRTTIEINEDGSNNNSNTEQTEYSCTIS